MNHYQAECTAEYNRQRIKAEIKQIRLEQFALGSRLAKPGRFIRMLCNVANWMISTGRQLHQRPEIVAVNSSHSDSNRCTH